MAEREITIKIKGDSSDLDRDVDQSATKAEKRLQRLQTQQARAQRNASRLASVATAAGLGLTGARVYAATRGSASPLGAGGIRGAARFAMIGARAAIAANPLTAVVGTAIAALGISALLGRRKRRQQGDQREQQTDQVLVNMLAESAKQTRSLQAIQVNTLATADPLGRGLTFQRNRLAAMGATVAPGAANQALRSMEVGQNLAATQFALQAGRPSSITRAISDDVTEIRTSLNVARLGIRQWGREMISGTMGALFNASSANRFEDVSSFGANRNILSGEGLYNSGGGRVNAVVSFLFGRSAGRGAFLDPARRAEGVSPEVQAQAAGADRTQRRQRLMALQQMGPGNLMMPAPTVRAGGESEYAFRVAQQRRGMQNESTVKWQQDVLRVLNQMRVEGEATREQVEQFNIQRNPLGFLGVD